MTINTFMIVSLSVFAAMTHSILVEMRRPGSRSGIVRCPQTQSALKAAC
jgi:hypothetical protein